MTPSVDIRYGDSWQLAETLEPASIDCIVTSPPYWGLRDYGHPEQFGLEATPQEYVAKLVDLFARLRPALKDQGTVWLNLGDSYAAGGSGGYGPASTLSGYTSENTKGRQAYENIVIRKCPPGLKPKDLAGIPWRVAFALQEDGWWLRSDIIWSKPNPMPESVTDRPTKAHEYVFLLSKGPRYFFDQDAVREELSLTTIERDKTPRGRSQNGGGSAKSMAGYIYTPELGDMHSNPAGRNVRTVWTITTKPYSGAHFATMPPDLAERCIKAGCPEGGTVLDPFAGSGTTLYVARKLGRSAIGFELNEEYRALIDDRLKQGVLC